MEFNPYKVTLKDHAMYEVVSRKDTEIESTQKTFICVEKKTKLERLNLMKCFKSMEKSAQKR